MPKAVPVKAVPSKSGMTCISADNRKMHTVPSSDYVTDESWPINKRMTTPLTHSPTLHEPDGALHWHMIMNCFEGFSKTMGWSFEDWKTPETRIRQDQVRILYRHFGQSTVLASRSRTLWWRSWTNSIGSSLLQIYRGRMSRRSRHQQSKGKTSSDADSTFH